MNPSVSRSTKVTLALILSITCFGAQAQSKKDLVAKIVTLNQAGIESVARQLTEDPAERLLARAGQIIATQVPEAKREATFKAIQAEAVKYSEAAVPAVRDMAVKLAPSTFGAKLEEKFTEDELKTLAAWMESPVSKKFAQAVPELNETLLKKLVEDATPLVDPKLKELDAAAQKILAGAVTRGTGKPAAKRK